LGSERGVVVESGQWGVGGTLRIQDVVDPIVAGLWVVKDGRLPATTGEIALQPSEARRVHAAVGDTVLVSTTGASPQSRSLIVVGTAVPVGNSDLGVTLPGAIPADTSLAANGWVAATSRDLTWSDVRAVNRVGGLVTSRTVLANPPAFCAADALCLDAGPVAGGSGYVEPPTQIELDEAARVAAEAAVIVVLVVLQIALLAGPAFAVQLRRRQRELGLVGASGGDAASLRRTVLASGVVLGLIGAGVGVTLGWTVVWALGGQFAWAPFADAEHVSFGIPALPPETLAVVLVGVIAALSAALVPALAAGRGDVIDTLRGRRPLPPVRRAAPLLGLVMGAIGLAIMVYGTTKRDAVVLGVGVVVGQLGVVMLMPAVVAWSSRGARQLSLAPRMAVRDAGRHRMRTTAAACAIAAAAAGSVAASSWSQSVSLDHTSSDVVFVEGRVVLLVGNDYDASGTPKPMTADHLAEFTRTITSRLPSSRSAALSMLIPVSPSGQLAGVLDCSAEGPLLDPGAQGQPCQGRGAGGYAGPVSLIADPAQIGVLLGPLAPLAESQRVLEAGGAVVTQPNSVTDGFVTLRSQTFDSDGSAATGGSHTVRVPALEVLHGAVPGPVLVGPAALRSGSPLAGLVGPGDTIVVVDPGTPDSPDAPTAGDRLQLGLLKAGLAGSVINTPDTSQDLGPVVATVGAVVTALLALLAGLMVTGLALADGRADMQTLAAVGGPPRLRRRIAASSAAYVTVLGCVTGAVSGLVAARVLVPLFVRSTGDLFRVPWLMIAFVVLAVPLLTAAVAFATTRSTVELTRRTGD
jgi:putative ABC transport system permease protein